MDLRVCLISLEYFKWGRYGGIGKVCREIGEGLAKRGVEVSVVVPRGENQQEFERVDDVKVYSHPLQMYPFTGRIYKKIDADVFHSQDPSWGTLIAINKMKIKYHVVTCQNPKSHDDWNKVQRFYPSRRLLYNRIIEPSVRGCLKRADSVFCQAKYVRTKARSIYGLDYTPEFLPNPVTVPIAQPCKTEQPTVLFLGRLDGEKKPEQFCMLAKRFTQIHFIVAGKAHNLERDAMLRERFASFDNLEFRGFIDGEEKRKALEESWILINTSVSECLPVSFLEASANRCAILSAHDPDGFSSSFGFHVRDGDYSRGLTWLLKDDKWREQGVKGYNYVKKVHEKEHVTDLHIQKYEELMDSR